MIKTLLMAVVSFSVLHAQGRGGGGAAAQTAGVFLRSRNG